MNETIRPDDRALPVEAEASPVRRRVCLVTAEVAGLDHNGGIGTANRALAFALRDEGYDVDILYTRVNLGEPFVVRGSIADQVRAFAHAGITLRCIWHAGVWNDWRGKAYQVMQHLIRHRYDLALFDDTHGSAYYALLARRTGNPGMQSTRFVVVAHSATQWIFDANQTPIATLEDARLFEMERRAIEMADLLIAPSAYILSRYRGFGWTLPADVVVQPNIVAEVDTAPPPPRHVDVGEIVFFGRLEARKGLWMFCRALDLIKGDIGDRVVTFLGKYTTEAGQSTGSKLLARTAGWPFEVRILPDYDRDQALNYLRGSNRLAVMPSREDNSPSVILECLELGIPFLASGGSGGQELIAPESRDMAMFRPTARALADKLLSAMRDGVDTAVPAFTHAANRAAYLGRIRDQLAAARPTAAAAARPVASASSSDRPAQLAIVPVGVEPSRAAAAIAACVRDFGGKVDIAALSAEPARLAEAYAAYAPSSAGVIFQAFGQYADACGALARGPERPVGFCHVSRLIPSAWMARAGAALGANAELAAVTGLVGETAETPRENLEPYFSHDRRALAVKTLRLGFAPALFPLSQDTNSGFAVIPSRYLALLATCSPFDDPYARTKNVDEWLHEVLMLLRSFGERFELIPDMPLDMATPDRPFEVRRLGNVMRALIGSELGFAPGTEQALLSRLAVEGVVDPARFGPGNPEFEVLARSVGGSASGWSMDDRETDHVRVLASIALKAGQPELAAELLAASILPPGYDEMDQNLIADHFELAACEILLFDRLASGGYTRVNLDHDWSLKLDESRRALELHANPANEGRASVEIPDVALDQVDTFTATVSLPDDASPVRCRIDIAAVDRSDQVDASVVIGGGETAELRAPVPPSLRRACNVFLSTEMASQLDQVEGALTRWHEPSFIRTAL